MSQVSIIIIIGIVSVDIDYGLLIVDYLLIVPPLEKDPFDPPKEISEGDDNNNNIKLTRKRRYLFHTFRFRFRIHPQFSSNNCIVITITTLVLKLALIPPY